MFDPHTWFLIDASPTRSQNVLQIHLVSSTMATPMLTRARAGSLMRLPNELRLLILEELLVSDQPIGSGQNGQGQVFPQILSTCRILYLLGADMLYRRNTLYCLLRNSPGVGAGPDQAELTIGPRIRIPAPAWKRNLDQKPWPIISRFRSLDLHLDTSWNSTGPTSTLGTFGFTKFFRLGQDALRNKSIVITFDNYQSWTQGQHGTCLPTILSSIKLLRCTSVDFITKNTNFLPTDQQLINDAITTIESPLPVIDLLTIWCDLLEECVRTCGRYSRVMIKYQALWRKIRDLYVMAQNYDFDRFAELKTNVEANLQKFLDEKKLRRRRGRRVRPSELRQLQKEAGPHTLRRLRRERK